MESFIIVLNFDPLEKKLSLTDYESLEFKYDLAIQRYFGLLKSPCFPIQFTVNFHGNFKLTFIIVQTDPESLKYKYITSNNWKLGECVRCK